MTTLSELFPAGGGGNTSDFVASGTLPNGKPVILKANGQVEVVEIAAGPVSQAIPAGSSTVYNSGTSLYNSISFDPNNPSKFVVIYRDTSNSGFGTAAVGNLTGNAITFGVETVFHSGATDSVDVSFDPNTSGKCVIAYQDDSASGVGKSVVGEVSGTGISFGSVVQFESGATSDIRVSYDSQTANKFMIVYRDTGNSASGTAISGSVSGTNISYGSSVVFNAATTINIGFAVNPTTADKFLVSYKDNGNSNYGTAVILSVSGTSVSVGTEAVFSSANTEFTSVSYNPNDVTKFVVAYRDNGGTGDGIAKVGTISGTSISSFSSAVTYSTGNTYYTSLAFDANTTGKLIIAYRDSANSDYGMISVGSLSGTSLTFTTAVAFNSATTHYISAAFLTSSADGGKFVVVYRNDGDSSYGTAIVAQIAATASSTNLTSTNFLGTATAAYTNGQTASIMLKGGISDNQTSLTSGSTYYVQPAGTFATSAGTPSVLAGEAVSATSLLLNGLATPAAPDEIPSQSGNTGKFLTTDGSAASWGTVAPAGLVLLSTVTASSSSTVDIETTFDSTYDEYILMITKVTGSNLGRNFVLRTKQGGAYNTSANYKTHFVYATNTQTTQSTNNYTNLDAIEAATNIHNTAGRELNIQFNISNPASTNNIKMVRWSGMYYHENSRMGHVNGAGGLDGGITSAITGLRFYMDSGNIATGIFRLYGVSK